MPGQKQKLPHGGFCFCVRLMHSRGPPGICTAGLWPLWRTSRRRGARTPGPLVYAATGPPASKALFRRLAVFCGSWSLEAREALFDDGQLGEPVVSLVGKLVRKSLVQRTDHGSRYRLLETMRQFASEKLTASGERERIHDAHLTWCLRLAEAIGIALAVINRTAPQAANTFRLTCLEPGALL